MSALPNEVQARTIPGRPPATLTAFVGRAAELDELVRVCGNSRLVSLIGPGPAADCPTTVTPFNGDHNAGIQAMSTRQFADTNGPLGRLQP